MPSKSKKQAMFMSAVAHSPKFAAKAGVPQSVGEDFHEADKRQHKFILKKKKEKKPGRFFYRPL